MIKAKIRIWRFYFLIIFLLLALTGLIGRLVFLNIIDRSFLLKQSQARTLRIVTIPAYRGMIADRFNDPLAISTPVDSVWIDPQLFAPTAAQLHKLNRWLQLPAGYFKQRMALKQKEFVYIKRHIVPSLGNKIKQLRLPGLSIKHEYRRYYPDGEVIAQVLGFTNIDDKGQEGLELAYNKWLSGTDGKKEVLKDRLGHVISNIALLKKPKQGRDLILSLDQRIQYLAYRDLKVAVDKYHAKSGSVVVLDVKTGEILAMANQPSFNPNNRPKIHSGRFRNRAVTDVFEPGSTIKPFNIALALESGHYTPQTTINTNPGWMVIDGHTIRDDGMDYGVITLTQLLQKSSNVGAAKVMLSLTPEAYWDLLRRMGFGQRTRSGFPGEASGQLIAPRVWRKITVASLAFGYGVSITALQLAHAYAILAAGGIKRPVTFLKIKTPPKGVREMKASIAHTLLHMLESVVQKGGTGTRARVPGYRVAGKTGTAYIAGPHGYEKNHYIASFVGIAPVSDPRLVVAVVVRDPQGQHFGGLVAAPVFAKVMGGALRLMNISPDSLSAAQVQAHNGIIPLVSLKPA